MAADCIVTGGAGFIGSHLVERLLQEGHRVRVVDDLSTGSWDNLAAVRHDPKLSFHQSTVSQWTDLEQCVAGTGAIFHLAASVGVDLVLQQTSRAIENNHHETASILAAASAHQVPVLLASSSEVYGRSPHELLSENDELVLGPPTVGRWSYACSKLMGEYLALALARERGLPVTIARIFNTVGPRQTGRHGMVLPRFIAAAQAGQPIPVHGDGRQSRCFCAVEDTVEALVRLHASPPARGQVVNVGNDEPIEILQLAQLVQTRCRPAERPDGGPPPIQFIPYEKAYHGATGFEELPRRRPRLDRLVEFTEFKPARRLPEIINGIVAGRGTNPVRSGP